MSKIYVSRSMNNLLGSISTQVRNELREQDAKQQLKDQQRGEIGQSDPRQIKTFFGSSQLGRNVNNGSSLLPSMTPKLNGYRSQESFRPREDKIQSYRKRKILLDHTENLFKKPVPSKEADTIIEESAQTKGLSSFRHSDKIHKVGHHKQYNSVFVEPQSNSNLIRIKFIDKLQSRNTAERSTYFTAQTKGQGIKRDLEQFRSKVNQLQKQNATDLSRVKSSYLTGQAARDLEEGSFFDAHMQKLRSKYVDHQSYLEKEEAKENESVTKAQEIIKNSSLQLPRQESLTRRPPSPSIVQFEGAAREQFQLHKDWKMAIQPVDEVTEKNEKAKQEVWQLVSGKKLKALNEQENLRVSELQLLKSSVQHTRNMTQREYIEEVELKSRISLANERSCETKTYLEDLFMKYLSKEQFIRLHKPASHLKNVRQLPSLRILESATLDDSEQSQRPLTPMMHSPMNKTSVPFQVETEDADNIEFKETSISDQHINQIYEAKLVDNGQKQNNQLRELFHESVLRRIRNRTLNLSDSGLGPACAKVLAQKFFTTNYNFMHYNLSNNAIGDEGVKNLCESIPQSNHIVKLNLQSNGITSEGAMHLGTALRSNISLVDLDLSNKIGSPFKHNLLSEKGAEYLVPLLETNRFLSFLNLSGNRIGDKGIQLILAAVSKGNTMVSLDISQNSITGDSADAISFCLTECKPLKRLNLWGNQLGNACIEKISNAFAEKSCHVEDLNLRCTGISSLGFRFIFKTMVMGAKYLAKLNLEDNEIGPLEKPFTVAMNGIAGSPSLKWLSLRNCGLNDYFGECLAKGLLANQHLTHLNLSKNDLTDSTAFIFAEVLSNKISVLKELNLSKNMIGDSGAIAMAGMLSVNEKLKNINFSANFLSEKSGRALQSTMQTNKTIETITLSDTDIQFRMRDIIAQFCRQNEARRKEFQAKQHLQSVNSIGDAQGRRSRVEQGSYQIHQKHLLQKQNLERHKSKVEKYELRQHQKTLDLTAELHHLYKEELKMSTQLQASAKSNALKKKKMESEMKHLMRVQEQNFAVEQLINNIHLEKKNLRKAQKDKIDLDFASQFSQQQSLLTVARNKSYKAQQKVERIRELQRKQDRMNRLGFASSHSSSKGFRSLKKGKLSASSKSPDKHRIDSSSVSKLLEENKNRLAANRPKIIKSELLMQHPFPHFLEITSTLGDFIDEETRSSIMNSKPGSTISKKQL